jgi:LytS/YehU family sensor histidine kinase
MQNYLLRFIIILIISFVFGYKNRNEEIESDRIKTELSALKSQINPHFLFNTLNGIYGQALTQSDQTADSIFKLSAMMRYVLTEATEEKVPLQDEINYLNSYLQLQNMRLTDKTNVNFVVTGNIESKMIAPLLFINFIENAFKYGVSNEVSSTIDISFDIKEDVVFFIVKNDIVNPNPNMESTQLGIKNTTRRLDLIYPNQYDIKINKSKTNFEVILKISDV